MGKIKILGSLLLTLTLSACLHETDPTGAELFASNCSGCHGSSATGGEGPNIRNKTAAQIKSAINYVSRMSSLQGKLSNDEMNAIADHLASFGSSSKPEINIRTLSGDIQLHQAIPGMVELKDNSGVHLSKEVVNGKFIFETSELQPPYMLKYVENSGRILFAMSSGIKSTINISLDSHRLIKQYINPNLLFESCGGYLETCFNDKELLNAVTDNEQLN